jgi:hypothetical protein
MMNRKGIVRLSFVAFTVAAASSAAVAQPGLNSIPETANCPITPVVDPPFLPPLPYQATAPPGMFWFGSERLWTRVTPSRSWC